MRTTRFDRKYLTNADRQKAYRLSQKEKGIKDIRSREYRPLQRRVYKPRAKSLLPFVGWDGEGRDVEGKHEYTLLHNSRGKYIHDPHGLSTSECLKFLLRESNDCGNEKAIHVGFAFGYDVNMMLKDVPEHLLRQLNGDFFNNETNQWERTGKEECKWFDETEQKWYYLAYRPRKFFRVSRSKGKNLWVEKTRGDGSVYYKRDIECTLNMWDVFGFFQCSFLNALNEYWPDKEEIPGFDTIVCQKENRGSFTEDTDEDVRFYCELECEYLARTMVKLRQYLMECGINNFAWDGTGAVARYVLQKAHIKDYMAPTPAHLKTPVGIAYSGGRIETVFVGREEGTFYDYDLNSAYPSIQCDLPCLAHSRFVHGGKKPGKISLVHLKWSFQQCCHLNFRMCTCHSDYKSEHTWFPLFFRAAHNGEIKYQPHGEGWFWQDEYLAALAFLEKSKVTLGHVREYVRVIECYNLETSCNHKPFDFLREQYARRKKMKAAHNAAQIALKLSINSCYGKLMQQVGGTIDNPPPFFQVEWGGMITSAVRAKLVMAALTTTPRNIIYFATDGILSRAPLDVPIGNEMNTWEIKNVYDEAVVVVPGVYWLRKGDTWFAATRGYEDVVGGKPVIILSAWANGLREVQNLQTRFITLRHSLAGNQLSDDWRSWKTEPRSLNIVGYSSKRWELPDDFDTRTLGHVMQVLGSRTVGQFEKLSAPYTVHYWATEGGLARSIEENEMEPDT